MLEVDPTAQREPTTTVSGLKGFKRETFTMSISKTKLYPCSLEILTTYIFFKARLFRPLSAVIGPR